MTTFDIRSFATLSTGTMVLKDPAGDPIKNETGEDCSITWHGPGTKEYLAAKHDFVKKKREEATTRVKGRADESKPEDEILLAAEFLARCVKSLNGFSYPGGARAMFADPDLGHFADQGDEFLGKRGNFYKKPETKQSDSSDTSLG